MFDVNKVRAQFPALSGDGNMAVYLDGPGGAQMPQNAVDAMAEYWPVGNSNLSGRNAPSSNRVREIVMKAREYGAIFLNAPGPENIVFGANMSTLTAHISRSIAREWSAGDEIIVTALDHFANVSFWQQAAKDAGVICHMVRITGDDAQLDMDHFKSLLSDKTRLVAFTLASNVAGSITPAKDIVKLAKAAGALTYVDAVHAAPHILPDVQVLDCDFAVCSVYKFFGPHLGFLYGKSEHLERLTPYKVEPATNDAPRCWETGTPPFAVLSGFNATIDYLVSLNKTSGLRDSLEESYQGIAVHEQAWSRAFLERAGDFHSMSVFGITDTEKVAERTSTFPFIIDGHASGDVVDHLAKHGIASGAGDFYAKALIDQLNLRENGGVVRVGALHYNTIEEIDILFDALNALD